MAEVMAVEPGLTFLPDVEKLLSVENVRTIREIADAFNQARKGEASFRGFELKKERRISNDARAVVRNPEGQSFEFPMDGVEMFYDVFSLLGKTDFRREKKVILVGTEALEIPLSVLHHLSPAVNVWLIEKTLKKLARMGVGNSS